MTLLSNVLVEVFRTLQECYVKCLLIGGQACVIYGAKTSTVDIDITILSDRENLDTLEVALTKLEAAPSTLSVPIAPRYLDEGHSLHYYCQRQDLMGMRLDILGKLPRLDSFEALWKRRFEFRSERGVLIPVLSIEDLVVSKKTGRLKDFVDISALINAHYASHRLAPNQKLIEFWLLECRDDEALVMFADKYRSQARVLISKRPLLEEAIDGNIPMLKKLLAEEVAQISDTHEAFRGPLRAAAKTLARKKRKTT